MSMTPANRLDLPVEIRIGDQWHPGFLEHRRRRGNVWEGFVRWSESPGETRIGWYSYDDLRAMSAPPL